MKLPKEVEDAIAEQDGKLEKPPGGNARKRVEQSKVARADVPEQESSDSDESKSSGRKS